jgi:hypothetical protein
LLFGRRASILARTSNPGSAHTAIAFVVASQGNLAEGDRRQRRRRILPRERHGTKSIEARRTIRMRVARRVEEPTILLNLGPFCECAERCQASFLRCDILWRRSAHAQSRDVTSPGELTRMMPCELRTPRVDFGKLGAIDGSA